MRVFLFTLFLVGFGTFQAVAQSEAVREILQETLNLSEMDRCMQAGQVAWAIYKDGNTEEVSISHDGSSVPWYNKPDAFMRNLAEDRLIRIATLKVEGGKAVVRLQVGPCELETRFENVDGQWEMTGKRF